MRIHFKSISATNFLGIGAKTQTLQIKQGKTLIFGKNGNGKSTMPIDALIFGLYDKSFRKTNKPQLQNWYNKKNCLVQISLTANGHEYVISRGINPNVFYIDEDGKRIDSQSANSDLQDWLETNVLKMSLQTFKQICVLGSADYLPFMRLTSQQRREVSEQLTDTTVISNMSKILKEKIQLHASNITALSLKLDQSRKGLQNLIIASESNVQEKETKLKQLANDGIKLTTKSKKLQSEIGILHDEVDEALPQWESIVLEAKLEKASLETNIASSNRQIEFFRTTNNCPTCLQTIDNKHNSKVINEINFKIQELQKIKDFNDVAISTACSEHAKISAKKKLLDSKEMEYRETKILLSEVSKQVKSYKQEIENIKVKEDGKLQQMISEVSSDVEQSERLLQEMHELNEVYLIASKFLKDNGIKSMIIKQYIPVLNSSISKYLSAFNFPMKFEFDENFEGKILGGSKDFSYQNLSMGQRQRVDLAMLFAWRDVARQRSNADTNLIVFDETLDMSLDREGIDSILDVIDSLTNGTSTIIVSHRELLLDKVDNSIRVDMVNGFTQLVNS